MVLRERTHRLTPGRSGPPVGAGRGRATTAVRAAVAADPRRTHPGGGRAAGGQGQITLDDGEVAVLLTKQRVDALQNDLHSAEETLSLLSSRRSRDASPAGCAS